MSRGISIAWSLEAHLVSSKSGSGWTDRRRHSCRLHRNERRETSIAPFSGAIFTHPVFPIRSAAMCGASHLEQAPERRFRYGLRSGCQWVQIWLTLAVAKMQPWECRELSLYQNPPLYSQIYSPPTVSHTPIALMVMFGLVSSNSRCLRWYSGLLTPGRLSQGSSG